MIGNRIRKPARRRSFTLTEMLVSITIIVILASVTLYGMATVQTTAKIQRTKSQIARIHELIMEQWESYETRRVGPPKLPPPHDPTPAELRLDGLRETIRLELPDRVTDVIELDQNNQPQEDPENPGKPTPVVTASLQSRPALSRAYSLRAVLDWNFENEAAECLYLILSRMQVGEANGLEFFTESEIGDTDGDGMPEILDAWGRPIRFYRWPVGFQSEFNNPQFDDPLNPRDRGLYQDDYPGSGGFAVVPLIISAGPDGYLDIAGTPVDASGNAVPLFYGNVSGLRPIPNDPFAPISADPTLYVGSVWDIEEIGVDNSIDNIHNHLIETGTR
jgi:prepilin-type N-terminal cleavage/methylation domain-containing protein